MLLRGAAPHCIQPPDQDEELFWRWMGSVLRAVPHNADRPKGDPSEGERSRLAASPFEKMLKSFDAFEVSLAPVRSAQAEPALPSSLSSELRRYTARDLRVRWDSLHKSLPNTTQHELKQGLRSLGAAFDEWFPSPWNNLEAAESTGATQPSDELTSIPLFLPEPRAESGQSVQMPGCASATGIQEHVRAMRDSFSAASREQGEQTRVAAEELQVTIATLANLSVHSVGGCGKLPSPAGRAWPVPGPRLGYHASAVWTWHARLIRLGLITRNCKCHGNDAVAASGALDASDFVLRCFSYRTASVLEVLSEDLRSFGFVYPSRLHPCLARRGFIRQGARMCKRIL